MRQSFFALNMTILPKRYRMGCLRHIVTHSRTHYDLKNYFYGTGVFDAAAKSIVPA